jgi:hypothetical protein
MTARPCRRSDGACVPYVPGTKHCPIGAAPCPGDGTDWLVSGWVGGWLVGWISARLHDRALQWLEVTRLPMCLLAGA